MTNKKLFVGYLRHMAELNCPYVWGGTGESLSTLSSSKLRAMETSTSNFDRVINFLLKKESLLYLRVFDCSGLGMYWLLKEKLVPYRMTASDMYKILCTPKDIKDVQLGDWVFGETNGKITHIGYCTGTLNGKKRICECWGRDVGVVIRDIDKGSYTWTKCGKPKIY